MRDTLCNFGPGRPSPRFMNSESRHRVLVVATGSGGQEEPSSHLLPQKTQEAGKFCGKISVFLRLFKVAQWHNLKQNQRPVSNKNFPKAMLSRCSSLTAFSAAMVLALAVGSHAQADRVRADQTLKNVPLGTSDIFKDTVVPQVVKPFQTDAPPETALTNGTMPSEITRRRITASPEQNALTNMEDGRIRRPKYDLLNRPDLFQNADRAVANAPNTLGGYFENTGGLCKYSDFGHVRQVTRTCSRLPVLSRHTCTAALAVDVDKEDTYQCSEQDGAYLQGCNQQLGFSCQPTPSCMLNSSTVRQVQGDPAYSTVGAPRVVAAQQLTHVHTSGPPGRCYIASQKIAVDLSSDVDLTDLKLLNGQYSQFAQIIVNGVIVDTYPSGGNSGRLNRRRVRNCRFCARYPVLYVGSSRLTRYCNANARVLPAPSLLPFLDIPAPSGDGVRQTKTNVIEIIVAGSAPSATFDLAVSGPCCDNLQPTVGEQCDRIVR